MKQRINIFYYISYISLIGLLCSLVWGCTPEPNRELAFIEVSVPPTQSTLLGEPVNLEGMVITGTYTDGFQETIGYRPQNVSGFDPERLGEQRLIITVQGKSAQFSVTVEKITLKVLNYPTGDGEEEAFVWEAFSSQVAHRGINIERENLSGEDYHSKVAEYIEHDELPDVVYAWPGGRSGELHTQSFLKDLAPFIQQDRLFSSFYGVLYADAQRASYRAIIPLGFRVNNLMYINNHVLQDCRLRPAEDYEDLKTQGSVIRGRSYEVLKIFGETASESSAALFAILAGRFNGLSWGRKLYSGEARFTDPGFVKVLEFIQAMYTDGIISAASFNAPVTDFTTNTCAYYLASKEDGLANLDPPAVQDAVAVDVFPEIPGPGIQLNNSISAIFAPKAATPMAGGGWGMSARLPHGSAKEKAAWRLIAWLTGKEVQEWLLQKGYIETPSRNDVLPGELDHSLETPYPLFNPYPTPYPYLKNLLTYKTIVVEEQFDPPVQDTLWQVIEALGTGLDPQAGAAQIQAAFDANR